MRSGSFTSLEILVNTAILTILVAIAIPVYTIFKDKANSAKARVDLRGIQNSIEVLASDTGKWPGDIEVGQISKKKITDLSKKETGLVAFDSKKFPN